MIYRSFADRQRAALVALYAAPEHTDETYAAYLAAIEVIRAEFFTALQRLYLPSLPPHAEKARKAVEAVGVGADVNYRGDEERYIALAELIHSLLSVSLPRSLREHHEHS